MDKVRNNDCWYWILPGFTAFAVAAVVSYWVPPVPSVHDDFGHLLIAETLLHGRLSNPTPPSAESLQTFHEVVYPRYAAKFPIGTGATIALGKIIFGTYCAGMWISAAFACSAITWMLMAHFQRNHALLFGMLAALHPYWQTGWSQDFTNGWLAVGSMSLIVGGLLRIRRRLVRGDTVDATAWRSATTIAVGIVIGIFSRPYETVVVTSILALPLLWKIIHYRWYRVPEWWLNAAPGICVLLLGFGFQGVINRSVTGEWFQLPYRLHEEQYGVAPVFVWQSPNEPSLGHRFLEQKKFHLGWSMDAYRSGQNVSGYTTLLSNRSNYLVQHWGWFIACSPMAILLLTRERKAFIGYLLAGVLGLYLINFVPWIATYYVASLLPIAILMAALVLRRVLAFTASRTSSDISRHRIRQLLIGTMVACQICWLIRATTALSANPSLIDNQWAFQRMQLAKELENTDGNDLIIVRYHPDHNTQHEWVFNSYDPPRSKIVWARWAEDLNHQLILDYPNRNIWVLDVRSVNTEQDSREMKEPKGRDQYRLTRWSDDRIAQEPNR